MGANQSRRASAAGPADAVRVAVGAGDSKHTHKSATLSLRRKVAKALSGANSTHAAKHHTNTTLQPAQIDANGNQIQATPTSDNIVITSNGREKLVGEHQQSVMVADLHHAGQRLDGNARVQAPAGHFYPYYVTATGDTLAAQSSHLRGAQMQQQQQQHCGNDYVTMQRAHFERPSILAQTREQREQQQQQQYHLSSVGPHSFVRQANRLASSATTAPTAANAAHYRQQQQQQRQQLVGSAIAAAVDATDFANNHHNHSAYYEQQRQQPFTAAQAKWSPKHSVALVSPNSKANSSAGKPMSGIANTASSNINSESNNINNMIIISSSNNNNDSKQRNYNTNSSSDASPPSSKRVSDEHHNSLAARGHRNHHHNHHQKQQQQQQPHQFHVARAINTKTSSLMLPTNHNNLNKSNTEALKQRRSDAHLLHVHEQVLPTAASLVERAQNPYSRLSLGAPEAYYPQQQAIRHSQYLGADAWQQAQQQQQSAYMQQAPLRVPPHAGGQWRPPPQDSFVVSAVAAADAAALASNRRRSRSLGGALNALVTSLSGGGRKKQRDYNSGLNASGALYGADGPLMLHQCATNNRHATSHAQTFGFGKLNINASSFAADKHATSGGATRRSCPNSLKRLKSGQPLSLQQATYETMRTIDMYLIRQIARSCMVSFAC